MHAALGDVGVAIHHGATEMADGAICGLGQAAMNPVPSLLPHVPEEAVP